ncbi:hypothetical protein SAMN06313486_10183 [Epsilonproteobacteria bacterium SCGC AD-308-P11]|nr:hypothetical protein SAMN06313486_10183 [Epsilonproteobacteria bacterium SCGC AD-308-P11]
MNSLFDLIDMKENFSDLTILSFGGGQDSTTILYKLIFDEIFKATYSSTRLLVLFADTGNEHPFTYQYMETTIKPLCKEHNIEFVSITNDMGYHGATWQSLTGQWQNAKPTIGSVAYMKTCTHNLKLNPQYRFVEKWISENFVDIPYNKRKRGFEFFAKFYGKIRWLVGIAKGEENRVADASAETALWKKQAIVVQYPLIEIALDRQGCQDYINSIGYEIPMPSNCMYCPYGSNHMEILWLKKTYPDRFNEWVELEQAKLDAWIETPKNLGVCGKLHKEGDRKGNAFTLLDLLAEAKSKYPNVSLAQLNEFKWSHGHCVSSKY